MSATKSTDRKRQSEAVNRLTWAITAINAHLEELQRIWARAFGISGSQWMILMAISDLDAGEGVPVNAVARMLHLDGSFVTPQSKLLERAGLVGRKPCPLDRRVVRLSLSNKALKQLGRDSEQQQAVADIVFAGLEGDELNEFITRLTSVRRRLEKTRLRLSHELRCRGCRNAGRAQSRCNVGSFCSRSGPAGPGNGDAARARPDQVVNLPPQTIQSHLEFDIRILRLVHPQCH